MCDFDVIVTTAETLFDTCLDSDEEYLANRNKVMNSLYDCIEAIHALKDYCERLEEALEDAGESFVEFGKAFDSEHYKYLED